MAAKPWRDGLHCEVNADGSATTFRIQVTMEQRGTAARESREDVTEYTAEEWEAANAPASTPDEPGEDEKIESTVGGEDAETAEAAKPTKRKSRK